MNMDTCYVITKLTIDKNGGKYVSNCLQFGIFKTQEGADKYIDEHIDIEINKCRELFKDIRCKRTENKFCNRGFRKENTEIIYSVFPVFMRE